MIETVDELVEALGGATSVGADLGIGRTAVEMWSTRGFVPNGWHFRLFVMCCRRGLTVSPCIFELSPKDFDSVFKFAASARAGAKAVVRRAG